jgi:hypothetical protein
MDYLGIETVGEQAEKLARWRKIGMVSILTMVRRP